MAKPAAEPVEKNILNLFLATKEVLLYNWKSVNGLSRSKCRDQSLYILQAREGLCSGHRVCSNCRGGNHCVNCAVCAFSYSQVDAVITESATTSCARRLFFLQSVTPTSSAVGQFSALISDLQISST